MKKRERWDRTDPTKGRRAPDKATATCTGCGENFQPAQLNAEGKCPNCRQSK